MTLCSGLVETLRKRAEIQWLMRERDRLKKEVECRRLAKEIYDYLEKHGYKHKKEEA